MRAKRSTKPPSPPPERRRRTGASSGSTAKKRASVARSLITEQRDFRVDYVAPTKPKYNKSVKKFQTKVMKALQRVHPVVSKIYTLGSVSTVTAANTEQCWQAFHLKPYDGQTAVPGAGTLYNEQAQADISDIGGELSATAGLSTNFTVKYAEMEISIQNSQAAADQNLDLYVLEYVYKAGHPMNQFASFNAALVAALAGTTAIGTAYDLNRFGTSPFDITALVRDYGIKIVKKVTFVLKSDDVVSYRHKDYKRHVFDKDTLQGDLDDRYCIQGKTTTCLLVGRGTAADAISGFRASCIKRYHIQPEFAKADVTYGGRD